MKINAHCYDMIGNIFMHEVVSKHQGQSSFKQMHGNPSTHIDMYRPTGTN